MVFRLNYKLAHNGKLHQPKSQNNPDQTETTDQSTGETGTSPKATTEATPMIQPAMTESAIASSNDYSIPIHLGWGELVFLVMVAAPGLMTLLKRWIYR